MAGRRKFAEVERLKSGRYRVRYTGPDGLRYSAPHTFDTKGDADTWAALRRYEIIRHEWNPTPATGLTFGSFAGTWLADREVKPRTRAHYGSLLDRQVLPTFECTQLRDITPAMVRKWHRDTLDPSTPTTRAHAYGLLRTILASALSDGYVSSNPAAIRGAGSTKRQITVRPASLTELTTITAAMPERLRTMVMLSGWTALRFGEVTELRRQDVDLVHGEVKVHRAVVHVDGEFIVGTPKSDAGKRTVAVPPHLLPLLTKHLANHVESGADALLFPSKGDPRRHLAPASLYRHFYSARDAAGRPDLRWHDLRHTGAVLAASTGATLAELMSRLGHSTPQAALRYQHTAQGRDQAIAAALSVIAAGEPDQH